MTDFRQDRGPLGPPPVVFRLPDRAGGLRRLGGWWRWAALAALLLVLYVAASIGKDIYADVLWFDSVGFRSVYVTRLTTRLWLFLAGGSAFFVLFLANAWLARRLAPSADDPGFEVTPELHDLLEDLQSAPARRIATAGILIVAALLSLAFAAAAAGEWQAVLLARNAQSFGIDDPQFHRDLSFYVFKLPVYAFALNWMLAALVVSTIGALAVYGTRALLYGFRVDAPRPILRHLLDINVPRGIKLHLSALIVAMLLVWIGRYYLSTFDLVYSTQGVDLGAFYTDVHANLPLLYALMALTGITAVLVVAGIFRAGLSLSLGSSAVWVLCGIGGSLYPVMVQNFIVQPNEISKEEQYLSRNIEMTRYAYGLDAIDERQFPASAEATEQEVAENQDTIGNVRLWDPEPLRAALRQIQTIRPLFDFLDADVDRYTIDGQYKQVMLSARELDPSRLPADAQTWVNSRLQFTHGYGYTVAAVSEAEADGTPKLIVSDIPLQGPLSTDRPELYFGEQPDHYIIVGGSEPEFTPTGTGENVQTKFQDESGVRLDSLVRKVVYAWKFADRNILISGAIDGNSRVIYHRNIQDRVHTIAPFLRLDADPYLVVDRSGMYWMQDAYTTTDRIPYSHRIDGVNYIRNSVKVVVNAYSGETTFYIMQPDEPLLKAYMAIYPDLFTPADEMPAMLQEHLRYPEDLFRLQTQAYLRYHISDARQFYQKEDQWDIPTEIFGSTEQWVRPYYVIARIPGGQSEEFMLIMPFVPLNRTNAISWLAARSDGEHYGKLVSFRFPSTGSVPGPTQVERRIDSDGRVSQQLTLWNQSGSKVIRGNLLMIPIGSANLFFEPLYLSAAGGGAEIPQLKRVVVVNGDAIAMEPTLARAIDVLFGRAQPSGLDSTGASVATPTAIATGAATESGSPTPQATPAATAAPAPIGGDAASLVAEARTTYDRAQTLLRAGDFAGYGEEMARLKEILDRLEEITGTPVPSP